MGTRGQALFLLTCTIAILGTTSSAQTTGNTQRVDVRRVKEPFLTSSTTSQASKSAAKSSATAAASAASDPWLGAVFDPGNSGDFVSDAMIAAGPKYLMAVSGAGGYRIVDKAGNVVMATGAGNFFSSLGIQNCCFDARVMYDMLHQRFVVAASENLHNSQSHVYVGVSATSDPTGDWYKFQLPFGDNDTWPDYPSIGVSSTALYISTDQIPNNTTNPNVPTTAYLEVVGINELLSGSGSLNITKFPSLKDNDGQLVYTVQPAVSYEDAPYEYVVGTNYLGQIDVYRVNTTGTPTLSLATVSVPRCVVSQGAPQLGTTQIIGPQAQITSAVYRLGSVWFAQACEDTSANLPVVRWYEVDPAGNALKQLGYVSGVGAAYFPALGVLPNGDVDLVYVTSSSSNYISGGYAHRSASDPPNTMPVSGVYTAGGTPYTFGARWGDLSGAAPDPDGKSVWGITQVARPSTSYPYLWATAVAQILTSGATGTPDFQFSESRDNYNMDAGKTATVTLTVTGMAGFSGTVNFAMTGLPQGVTATFDPATVTGSGTTTMTIHVAPDAPGAYSNLTITATSGNLSHSLPFFLVTNPPTQTATFSLTGSANTLSVNAGASGQLTYTVAAQNGFQGDVSFSVAGLPAGVTGTFNPASVTTSGTTSLTISAAATAVASTSPVTVTASSGAIRQTSTFTLNVTAIPPAPGDFSLSATPTSATVQHGGTANYTLAIATQNGFTGAIAFTCSGLPIGFTCAFDPNPFNPGSAGGNVALRVSVPSSTGGFQSAPPPSMPWMPLIGFGMAVVVAESLRKRAFAVRTAVTVLLVVGCLYAVGCGGVASSSNPGSNTGSNGNPSPTPGGGSGTPSGSGGSGSGGSGSGGSGTPSSYQITITAKSGALTHTTAVTLTVQP